jgi:hypothetical protein
LKQLTIILENLFKSKYNEAEKQLHKNLMTHLLKKYSN